MKEFDTRSGIAWSRHGRHRADSTGSGIGHRGNRRNGRFRSPRCRSALSQTREQPNRSTHERVCGWTIRLSHDRGVRGAQPGHLGASHRLRRDLPRSARSSLGLGLLGVFGTCLLVAAAFPIDLEGTPETLAGRIHSINGPIAFLSLTAATNLLSRRFKLDAKWRPLYRTASVLALIMIPAFISGAVTAAREIGMGIAQRILLVTFAAWYLVVASRLRTNATEATRASIAGS